MVFHERFIAQNLLDRPIGDQSAAIEKQHPAAAIEDQIEIVRGQDAGAIQALKEGDQFTPATRIERHRRFVQKQDVRAHGQDSRQGRTPFFPPDR